MKIGPGLSEHLLCDCHIHVGSFRDTYYSPAKVVRILRNLGVAKWAVMSTSTFDGIPNYRKIEAELREMLLLAPSSALPVFIVSPEMLELQPDLAGFLTFPYRAIKIHGFAHPWEPEGEPLRRVMAIAREHGLPVMFHTGGCDRSDAGAYARLCSEFHEVTIVLCHGRPIGQAIDIARHCGNVSIDTAFMPIESIEEALAVGLEDRILFGSDLPINKQFYPRRTYQHWYHSQLADILRVSPSSFRKIITSNFFRFFCVNETEI